jgi:hypothetical protein
VTFAVSTLSSLRASKMSAVSELRSFVPVRLPLENARSAGVDEP